MIDEKGLPANLYAERCVLGSILLQHLPFADALSILAPDDFSIEKHRRIYRRMAGVHERGDAIDRVTVANELMEHGELESCDGLTYLATLDDGLPELVNVGAYLRIVKEKSVRRQAILVHQHSINELLLEQDNPSEVMARAERTLHELGDQSYRRSIARSAGEIIDGAGVERFLEPAKQGIRTPWAKLNELTLGLQPGDLILLAGRPSTGKSTGAYQIINRALAAGVGVLLFTLETVDEAVLQRLGCMSAGVDSQDVRHGDLTTLERDKLRNAVEHLHTLPLWINEKPVATASSIHAEVRRMKALHDIRLVVVDYLQLMKSPGSHQNRNLEVAEISRDLKLAAIEFQIPFLVLSQFSRAVETEHRRPVLSDLRDSGALEQDGDLILFLHPDREVLGYTELIVAKQRNGPLGTIGLRFLKNLGRLIEQTEETSAAGR